MYDHLFVLSDQNDDIVGHNIMSFQKNNNLQPGWLVPICTPGVGGGGGGWVERGTARELCLVQEHSVMTLARARTQSTQSGVQCTNNQANMSHKG